MKRKRILSLMALGGLAALALSAVPNASRASSHREAPLISKDPEADNTDLYAFVSPDKPDTVTIIANYIPLEEPAGGPNFYGFSENARYEIHIDNNGDAREDITYRFTFRTKILNKETFLYNTGPITSLNDRTYNYRQFYNVTRIEAGKSDKSKEKLEAEAEAAAQAAAQAQAEAEAVSEQDDATAVTAAETAAEASAVADEAVAAVEAASKGKTYRQIGTSLPVPPVHIGPRSTPNYEQLASEAIKKIDGNTLVFAGQRDDAFFVDLGSIFDLGGLRPFNNAHLIPLNPEAGVDGVGGYNTHSIAIQVPIKHLTRDRQPGDKTKSPVLGIYASASRPRLNVMRDGESTRSYRQVSRLGNPLVNEVIIPLGKKDRWNASDPANDKQFLKYYLKPELAGLVNLLYPTLPDTRTENRQDLVAILLTGVKLPDGSPFTFTGNTPADLLRLNVAVKPTAAVGKGDPLGVLNGDLAGFPNGRRLEDDVTDIELRAVADGYGSTLNKLLGLPNNSPNNLVGDGVNKNDLPFLSSFPYIGTPHQGYEHEHHQVDSMTTPPIK